MQAFWSLVEAFPNEPGEPNMTELLAKIDLLAVLQAILHW
jgi:hypothetical protein